MLYEDKMPGAIKQESQRVFAVENRGKSYKCAVLFPSTNPKGDLVQGKDTGIFDNCRIIGIEGVDTRKEAVRKFLAKQDKNALFIPRTFDSIRFAKYVEPNEIDYLGADLCGNITAPVAARFYQNQQYFADNMRLPMTIRIINRKQGAERARDEALEQAIRYKPDEYVKKMLKNVPMTTHFGMSKKLKRNLYVQLYMLLHSMPSKKFVFHRIIVYRNGNTSSYMAFLDISLKNCVKDIRRENRLKKILTAYGNICPSRQPDVQLTKPKKRGRPRLKKAGVKKANTVPFHIMFAFKSRADMNRPVSKARMTRLAKKLAAETGRDMQELRGSMIAGLNRHWTEVSKARKVKRAKK